MSQSRRSFVGVGLRGRQAFTLVELLVVIAIIGILVAMLLPAVQSAREAARRMDCQNRIRQIALAMHNYHTALGAFPPTGITDTPKQGPCEIDGTTTSRTPEDPNGKYGSGCSGPSWAVLILPYLEQQTLHDQMDMDAPFTELRDWAINGAMNCGSTVNFAPQLEPNPAFHCPTDPVAVEQPIVSCYLICQGGGEINPTNTFDPLRSTCFAGNAFGDGKHFFTNGVAHANSEISTGKITDGTSKTLLLGENRLHFEIGTHTSFPERSNMWSAPEGEHNQWGAPAMAGAASNGVNADLRTGLGFGFQVSKYYSKWILSAWRSINFGSWHPTGANFAFADGSVHFLNDDIDLEMYRSMGRRADGDQFGG